MHTKHHPLLLGFFLSIAACCCEARSTPNADAHAAALADGFFTAHSGQWKSDDAGRLRICIRMSNDDIVLTSCARSTEQLLPSEYLARIGNPKSKFEYAGMSKGTHGDVVIYFRAIDQTVYEQY